MTVTLKEKVKDLISGTQKITHHQGDYEWSDSRLEIDEAVDQILSLVLDQIKEKFSEQRPINEDYYIITKSNFDSFLEQVKEGE